MTVLNDALVRDLGWQKLTLNAEQAREYLRTSFHLPQFDLIIPDQFRDMNPVLVERKPVTYVTRLGAQFLETNGIPNEAVVVDGLHGAALYVTTCFNWDEMDKKVTEQYKKVTLSRVGGISKAIAFKEDNESIVIELINKPTRKRPTKIV